MAFKRLFPSFAVYILVATLSLLGALSIRATMVRIETTVLPDTGTSIQTRISVRGAANPKSATTYPLTVVIDTAGQPVTTARFTLTPSSSDLSISGTLSADQSCTTVKKNEAAVTVSCTFSTGGTMPQLISLTGLSYTTRKAGIYSISIADTTMTTATTVLTPLLTDLSLRSL